MQFPIYKFDIGGTGLIEKEEIRKYILWLGSALLISTVVFAILFLTGVLSPNIFPPTGQPLDPSPLASVLFIFFLLIVIMYVSTRILDFGLKYGKEVSQSTKAE